MKVSYLFALAVSALTFSCGPRGLNENQSIDEAKKQDTPKRSEEDNLGLTSTISKQQIDELNLPAESWERHKILLPIPGEETRAFGKHCPNFDVDQDGGINSVPQLVNGVQSKLPNGDLHSRGDGPILSTYIRQKAAGFNETQMREHDWEIMAGVTGERKQKIAILSYLNCLSSHPDKPLDLSGDGAPDSLDALLMRRLATFGYPPSVLRGAARVKTIQRFSTVCRAYFQVGGYPFSNGKSMPTEFRVEQVECNANMDPFVRLPDLQYGECPADHPLRRNLTGLSRCMGWKQVNDGKMIEAWRTYGGL